MKFIKTLSKFSGIPKFIRLYFKEIIVKDSIDTLAKESNLISQRAKERLPHCLTVYARQQLKSLPYSVQKDFNGLNKAANRKSLAKGGEGRVVAISNKITNKLKNIKDIIETDIRQAAAIKEYYAQRRDMAKNISIFLFGPTKEEYERYDARFERGMVALNRSEDLNATKNSMRDLQIIIQGMKTILDNCRKLQSDSEAVYRTFNMLDRYIINREPWAREIHASASQLISATKECLESGDINKGLRLLSQAHIEVDTLSNHTTQILQGASDEIDLWINTIKKNENLQIISEKITLLSSCHTNSERLTKWISMRSEIETVVLQAASITRSQNAKLLSESGYAYEWQKNSEKALIQFAKYSNRRWRESVL